MVDMHFLEMISDPILVVHKENGIVNANQNIEAVLGFSRQELLLEGKSKAPFWIYEQDFTEFIFDAKRNYSNKPIIMDYQDKCGNMQCAKVSLHALDDKQKSLICLFKRCFSSSAELPSDIFRSIADHTNVMMGVMEVLEEEGDICNIMVNQATAEFIGPATKPESYVGKKLKADCGFRKDDIDFWIRWFKDCEEADRPRHKCLYLHSPDGQKRWLQSTAAFIGRTPNGRPRFSYIIEDITKRKEAEDKIHTQNAIYMKELEAKNAALLDAQREKDQFMLSISHEFRTPIGGIIGLADELMEVLQEEHQQIAIMIRRSAEELLEFIDDILRDFEGVQSHHARFNLEQFIQLDPSPQRQTRSSSVPCIASHKPLPNTRILLAEDNRVNQRVVKRHLEKFGCEVDIAEDGVAAVELLKTRGPGYYSLILMDLFMPHMNGLEATMEIRKWESEKYKTPIVALTANIMGDLREKCLMVGMDEFLSKPCSPEVLRETLAKLLVLRCNKCMPSNK